jgi:hypothetical protein
VNLPPAADQVILRALEKRKEDRFSDTTDMANALQEVLDHAREASNPLMSPLPSTSGVRGPVMDLLETRRGEMPMVAPPPMPPPQQSMQSMPQIPQQMPEASPNAIRSPVPQAYGTPVGPAPVGPAPVPLQMQYAPQTSMPMQQAVTRPRAPSSMKWIWWVVGLLALGAAAGAALALLSNN